MYILPSTKVSRITEKGTDLQIATATYFDKNGNGIIERCEADTFNSSKITKNSNEITITSPDGYVDKFENVYTKKDDTYYKQGTIPIAVLDSFQGGKVSDHGIIVSNILKSENPNLALTQIDQSPHRAFNRFHIGLNNFLKKHPNFEKQLVKNKTALNIWNSLYPKSLDSHFEAYKELQTMIQQGAKFKAVNYSSGVACSYPEINSLVSKELGVEITPENISKYRTQIKEILNSKKNKKINFYTHIGTESIRIKKFLNYIDTIESFSIPVYVGGSYKWGDSNDIETFNLLALADNVIVVGAGQELQNGEIIHAPNVSNNSLTVNKDGKKRIEDSLFYSSENGLYRGSTSFAVPKHIAKIFKD